MQNTKIIISSVFLSFFYIVRKNFGYYKIKYGPNQNGCISILISYVVILITNLGMQNMMATKPLRTLPVAVTKNKFYFHSAYLTFLKTVLLEYAIITFAHILSWSLHRNKNTKKSFHPNDQLGYGLVTQELNIFSKYKTFCCGRMIFCRNDFRSVQLLFAIRINTRFHYSV